MIPIEIKCRDKILHKKEGGDLDIEEDKYEIKAVKMFLISLFGNYHYSGYITLIDNMYFVFLPPEFYLNIPIGYVWG
jgi:hypothetical protein